MLIFRKSTPQSRVGRGGFGGRRMSCCSVTKSCLTLRPCRLLHARYLCSLLSPRVCSNSCPLGWSCYLTIWSSAVHFSFCLQSFPASGSFPMSQLITSDGHSIGASATVLPMNIQGWFPLGLTGFISLQTKALSRVFYSTKFWRHQFFSIQPSL